MADEGPPAARVTGASREDDPWADSEETQSSRVRMVEGQLAARDVRDPRVLEAMRRVPRHLFVPPELQDRAYSDAALSLSHGQTISQPYIVGLMTQSLELWPGERILEIGTGSGYQAAVLATLGAEVFTMDRIAELSYGARDRLARLGLADRIHFAIGDGSLGWPQGGTFDGIIVTAGAPSVPPALVRSLARGGRLVIPVGMPGAQDLIRVRLDAHGHASEERLCGCAFVPLIGREGWPESGPPPDIAV